MNIRIRCSRCRLSFGTVRELLEHSTGHRAAGPAHHPGAVRPPTRRRPAVHKDRARQDDTGTEVYS